VTEPLNISVAEERAKLYTFSEQTARDLLALAALYREAVEALENVPRLPSVVGLPNKWKMTRLIKWADAYFVWQDGLDSVLVKARAALSKGKS